MKQLDTNSDYAVTVRREELAKKYLAGTPPQVLFKEYHNRYGLSKHSFDKDITYAREQIAVSVRDNIDNIVNDQFVYLNSVIADCTSTGDISNALKAAKQVTDVLKLVQGHGNKNQINVQFNQNNVTIPDMPLDELKRILGKE